MASCVGIADRLDDREKGWVEKGLSYLHKDSKDVLDQKRQTGNSRSLKRRIGSTEESIFIKRSKDV